MYDGITLGFLTWISFLVSFVHIPQKAKDFFLKNFFITDLLSMFLTFYLLTSISKSVVAVVASMTCGLLVNLSLVTHNFIKNL